MFSEKGKAAGEETGTREGLGEWTAFNRVGGDWESLEHGEGSRK